MKIGFEAIYYSQRNLFNSFDFTELKNFLIGIENDNWPFINSDFKIQEFESIPRFEAKYKLKLTHCELMFHKYSENTLLFRFKFGGIPMTINLLNRNLDWVKDAKKYNTELMIYPTHFAKKI